MRWWVILGLIFIVGVLLGNYPLAVFAAMVFISSAIARWWQRRALDQVTYQRHLIYSRGFPGEQVDLQVEVENWKFLPIPWLHVSDLIPYAIAPTDEDLLKPTHIPEIGLLHSLFSLRWYERDKRLYTLFLKKRGIHRLGPARLESGDLFGLFETIAEEQGPVDFLTVYPEPISQRKLGLRTDDPLGESHAKRRLYDDPNLPMGVREYYPEDDLRRIHWPATAHTGQLQVKVYQPISARVMVVCLNATTLPHYWEGTRPELLEYLVKVAAGLVQRGIQDGYRVGLMSNGSLGQADQPFRIQPGRSPDQLPRLFTALAGLTTIVSGSFERFLMREVPRLPYGATLVIVTGLMNPDLAEAVLRLKQRGRRIKLFSFTPEAPPVIPGVEVLHLPVDL